MRVLLVPNRANPEAIVATAQLATWCVGAGIEPVIEAADASASDLDGFAVQAADLHDLTLAVALGGDGTILKAVHLVGEQDVPLLGVKFGRLGFLSGATSATMRDAVAAAVAGDARVERRSTLQAEVIMEGRSVGSYRALNEVALARGISGRVVAFDLAIDGRAVMKTRADALITATATGSTAYALSAGGPVVDPSVRGMVVVPVAPHTLAARAIVTGPASVVEITLPQAARSDACLVVDGDVRPCRRAIERVIITPGEHDVSLVKLDGRDFYETVSAEFFGG